MAIAALFFAAMQCGAQYVDSLWLRLALNTVCVGLFVGHIVYHDFPLSNLPVVGKYFK